MSSCHLHLHNLKHSRFQIIPTPNSTIWDKIRWMIQYVTLSLMKAFSSIQFSALARVFQSHIQAWQTSSLFNCQTFLPVVYHRFLPQNKNCFHLILLEQSYNSPCTNSLCAHQEFSLTDSSRASHGRLHLSLNKKLSINQKKSSFLHTPWTFRSPLILKVILHTAQYYLELPMYLQSCLVVVAV